MNVLPFRLAGLLISFLALPLLFTVPAAASHMPHRTVIIHVKPFLASGALASGYTVVGRGRGHCFSTSAATTRRDAFRCSQGNVLFDPCFSNPLATQVACIGSKPTDVFILTLTKALPQPSSGSPSAWELKIRGGPYCRLNTGATFLNHGRRANFDCSDHTWLFGRADRTHEPWIIRKGSGEMSKLKWVKVAKAWF